MTQDEKTEDPKRSGGVPENQPSEFIALLDCGAEHALLAEATREVDECRGVVGRETGSVR